MGVVQIADFRKSTVARSDSRRTRIIDDIIDSFVPMADANGVPVTHTVDRNIGEVEDDSERIVAIESRSQLPYTVNGGTPPTAGWMHSSEWQRNIRERSSIERYGFSVVVATYDRSGHLLLGRRAGTQLWELVPAGLVRYDGKCLPIPRSAQRELEEELGPYKKRRYRWRGGFHCHRPNVGFVYVASTRIDEPAKDMIQLHDDARRLYISESMRVEGTSPHMPPEEVERQVHERLVQERMPTHPYEHDILVAVEPRHLSREMIVNPEGVRGLVVEGFAQKIVVGEIPESPIMTVPSALGYLCLNQSGPNH